VANSDSALEEAVAAGPVSVAV